MNADYPANPATPGAHPFPGVTQAVPQGPGAPEAPPAQWGAVAPRMQSQPGAGGGPVHPGAPAVPPPSPYASPGGSTGSASPAAPSQPMAPPAPSTPPAASAPPAPSAPPALAPHAPAPHAPNPLAPTVAAPIRRASLRTGTLPVETKVDDDPVAPKKFSLFGKKAETDAPTSGTTTTTLRRKGGPRKVRAMLVSIDPWSAMKMSFLTSIAAGIALVVAVSVVWGVLNTMGVFTAIRDQITTLFNLKTETSILQYFEYSKVMSGAILVAVFNAVILTALGTISALIYNIVGKLVGGVYVTLSDD